MDLLIKDFNGYQTIPGQLQMLNGFKLAAIWMDKLLMKFLLQFHLRQQLQKKLKLRLQLR